MGKCYDEQKKPDKAFECYFKASHLFPGNDFFLYNFYFLLFLLYLYQLNYDYLIYLLFIIFIICLLFYLIFY